MVRPVLPDHHVQDRRAVTVTPAAARPQYSSLDADAPPDERRHIEIFAVIKCRLALVESAPAHAFQWQGFLLRFDRRLLRHDKLRFGGFLNGLVRR